MEAVMRLPGQLKDTTLGDLLGLLHRERATGYLELLEPGGRGHRVELRDGRVQSVETEAKAPRLGELLELDEIPTAGEARIGEALIDQGHLSHLQISEALHRQTLARLEVLFSISDAAVRFRAPRPQSTDPTDPSPLRVEEFLPGKPRKRERSGTRHFPASRRGAGALAVLGLPNDASAADIRVAFRQLAQEHHPDRHPDASADERARLFKRFAEISRAYHTLTS